MDAVDEDLDSLDSEDETQIPGSDNHILLNGNESGGNEKLVPANISIDAEIDSEDETLMSGSAMPEPTHEPEVRTNEEVARVDNAVDSNDETIMPGQFEFEDDDATIRKGSSDYETSFENFIDLGSLGEDYEKNKFITPI